MKGKFNSFNHCLLLLWFLLIVSEAFAISVNRTVIVQREPGSYVGGAGAVLNSKTGQTLVVWQKGPRNVDKKPIWGQLLEPDGKLVGSPFQIVSASFGGAGSSIAYDPDTNQFVLVLTKANREYSEVYAVRLHPSGRRKGKFVLISHPHNPNFDIYNIWPGIIYDPKNKANIITWTRYVEGPDDPSDPKGIYGAILNSDLSVRKEPVFIQKIETGPGITFGPFIGDAAIHPIGNILFTQVLYTPVTFAAEFSIAQVDATLKKPKATIKTLPDAPTINGCQYGVCFDIQLMEFEGDQLAALYSLQDGIRKRQISTKGIISGSAAKFFGEPVRSEPLKISGSAFAESSTAKEVAVLGFFPSEIEQAEFWLQLANAKGKAVGSPILIESGVDCIHGGMITALPFSPAQGHLYAVLYVEGERDNPPLDDQGTGLVLLRVNTAP